MATVLASPRRYGSAAEVAAYAGVSPKTIRRMVDAGAIRGLRIRRRLVIPFEDVDRLIEQEACSAPPEGGSPTMATAHVPSAVDSRGRAIPMTVAEVKARAASVARGLDALDDMGDEDEQRATLEALMEGLNAEPLSARKRFR